MKGLLCWVGALVGFVVTTSVCYFVLVEGLGWEHGVVKITAPLALGGAFLGYDGAGRILGVDPPTSGG